MGTLNYTDATETANTLINSKDVDLNFDDEGCLDGIYYYPNKSLNDTFKTVNIQPILEELFGQDHFESIKEIMQEAKENV